MTSARFSLSLVGVIGVFVAVLAAAALWLTISDPVTTANAVNAASQGDVSPIIRELAGALYDAMEGILKYL
jgi:multidrug resistance efflux pump